MTKVNPGNVDAKARYNVDEKGRYQYHYNPAMTDEQKAVANEKLNKIKQHGKVTITNKGYGLSQSFMENFMKEQIEAGNIVDKNDDGEEDVFTQMNKRDLGSAFETTHKNKKYSTDFTHMKKGTSFTYSYDEMANFIDKAGYKFKEPAKPKDAKVTDNKPEPAAEDKKAVPTPEVPTPKPVEEPKNEKLDTVILDSTTYTDENGNVIADDTRASINGQPYHSRTGFGTFGTLSPEPVDWKQYSMKELDGLDAAPTNKKVATEPDKASDKVAPVVSNMETPVVDVAPVVSATHEEKSAPESSTVTADVAPKSSTELQTPQEKFEASLASDSELANADSAQRASILGNRKNAIESQIADLKKPTVVMQKGFLGLGKAKPKIVKTADENTVANKDKITQLEQKLGDTENLKVYADVATHMNQKYASTKYVDSEGKTVAEYPDYTVVKYKKANGDEVNAARVETFNKDTSKNEYSYYTFDVQKVREFSSQPERLQAVPDMKNPLTEGQEVRY